MEPAARRMLDASYITENVSRLEARVQARFPTRGLAATAAEVRAVLAETIDGIAEQRQRMRVVRTASRLLVAAIVIAALIALTMLVDEARDGIGEVAGWPSFFESLINNVVFTGVAIFFVWSIPQRLF